LIRLILGKHGLGKETISYYMAAIENQIADLNGIIERRNRRLAA
jgi:hypothetical protein